VDRWIFSVFSVFFIRDVEVIGMMFWLFLQVYICQTPIRGVLLKKRLVRRPGQSLAFFTLGKLEFRPIRAMNTQSMYAV
jgi:hypothetical protein